MRNIIRLRLKLIFSIQNNDELQVYKNTLVDNTIGDVYSTYLLYATSHSRTISTFLLKPAYLGGCYCYPFLGSKSFKGLIISVCKNSKFDVFPNIITLTAIFLHSIICNLRYAIFIIILNCRINLQHFRMFMVTYSTIRIKNNFWVHLIYSIILPIYNNSNIDLIWFNSTTICS